MYDLLPIYPGLREDQKSGSGTTWMPGSLGASLCSTPVLSSRSRPRCL